MKKKTPSFYYMSKTDGTSVPVPMNRKARKMYKSKEEPWIKPQVGTWTEIFSMPVSDREKKRLAYLEKTIAAKELP